MNYPADKHQYKVDTRRDGKLLNKGELNQLYRDDTSETTTLEVENSLTFDLPHEVVFKRFSIKQRTSALFEEFIIATKGQLCLEMDKKPIAGAAGCKPIADYLRLELNWEDHQLGLGRVGDVYGNDLNDWI